MKLKVIFLLFVIGTISKVKGQEVLQKADSKNTDLQSEIKVVEPSNIELEENFIKPTLKETSKTDSLMFYNYNRRKNNLTLINKHNLD